MCNLVHNRYNLELKLKDAFIVLKLKLKVLNINLNIPAMLDCAIDGAIAEAITSKPTKMNLIFFTF